MDNSFVEKIKDLLTKNDRVAIAVGKEPGLDDMAAALSMYLALTQLGKKVTIASPTQPLVAHSSLIGIDKVKSQFEGEGGDLIVAFPYKEGEIEKVSYTIENGFLNIVVKSGENGLTFQEQDVRYTRAGGVPQLLFIIGTPRLADLGNLFNPDALKDTTIVNVDNKTDNQGFGDVVIVSQKASSVSEEVGNIIAGLGVDFDIDLAQNLLHGITAGTDNFQHPKTSASAFEMVALLMRKGATRRRQPVARNEEHVSSFMPEQMLSQSQQGATPFRPQAPVQNTPLAQRPVQNKDRRPPSDWLTPKVYKGSTNI